MAGQLTEDDRRLSTVRGGNSNHDGTRVPRLGESEQESVEAQHGGGASRHPFFLPPPNGLPAPASRGNDAERLHLDDSEAADLSSFVAGHRRELKRSLGRDPGEQVALLDYISNLRTPGVEVCLVATKDLEALRRAAILDALTGLHNRHYFQSVLSRNVASCHRYRETCSLLLLDVDDFKAVNDRNGHRAGDRVLRVIGRLLRTHTRATDVACRYGGDEFAILLPHTSRRKALKVARRIRAGVHRWFARRSSRSCFEEITVSVGIATLPGDGSSPEGLLVAADRALYLAKEAKADRNSNRDDSYEEPPRGGTPADRLQDAGTDFEEEWSAAARDGGSASSSHLDPC